MRDLKDQDFNIKMLDLKNKVILKIKLQAYHSYYLNRFIVIAKQAFSSVHFKSISVVSLPKTYERFTLLRSPHVDIKARDQFERITHKKLITLVLFTGKDVSIQNDIMRIIKYLQNSSLGLDISITTQIE
jgi:small subunit ribosomal protein S10